MFKDTITLFNRYHSKTLGDTWYPHILHNVELTKDKASIWAKYGAESKDNATLIVNFEYDADGNIVINELPYYPPKEWAKQVNDDLPNSITFNDDASLFDFFIVGEYTDTQPILDEDYKKGFYNELNSQYDYCYAVTSVGGAYKLIPHFEILAK